MFTPPLLLKSIVKEKQCTESNEIYENCIHKNCLRHSGLMSMNYIHWCKVTLKTSSMILVCTFAHYVKAQLTLCVHLKPNVAKIKKDSSL